MFLALFAGCNFSMEVWKQRALQQFESVYIVPVFQAALIVLAVLTGGVSASASNIITLLLLLLPLLDKLSTVGHDTTSYGCWF